MEAARPAKLQDYGTVSKLQLALRDFQERLHDGLFILTRQESANVEGYVRDVSEASSLFQKLANDLPNEFYQMPSQRFEQRVQAEIEALQSLEPERRRALKYWKARSESLQSKVDGPFAQRCLDSAGSYLSFTAQEASTPATTSASAQLAAQLAAPPAATENMSTAALHGLQTKLDSLTDEQQHRVLEFLAQDGVIENGADEVVNCDIDRLPAHRVQALAKFVDGLAAGFQGSSALPTKSSSSAASAEHCGTPEVPRPILKDLWQDRSRRFVEELEFIQLLADPNYAHFLALRGYLEDESFIEFLHYLRYWWEPPYVQHVVYPQALRMLEMLLTPEIRKRMHRPATLALLTRSMMWKWAHMPEGSSKFTSGELASQGALESALGTARGPPLSDEPKASSSGSSRPPSELRGLPLLCRVESEEASQGAQEETHEPWRSKIEALGRPLLEGMGRKHELDTGDEDMRKRYKLSASGKPVDFMVSSLPSGVVRAADAGVQGAQL